MSTRPITPERGNAPARPRTGVAPAFRALTPEECTALLARNLVGRLAFCFQDRVDIQPISYVYEDGRIFARTSEGAKVATVRHSPWVAFEVDETEGIFDWRSVVVHGTIYALPSDGSPTEMHAWRHATTLLRQLVPATGTPEDPVAFRDVVFEIVVDSMTGREASTRLGRRRTRARRQRARPDIV